MAGPNDLAAHIPVVWAGTDWNIGDVPADGTCRVITSVDGWYWTPALDGNDVPLALTDGVLPGFKIIAQREVTLNGSLSGPRAPLLSLARQLAALASGRGSTVLAIGEVDESGGPLLTLTAQVRADTGQFQADWVTRYLLNYQVVLTAPDPLLYEAASHLAVLTVPSSATGRVYARRYSWRYPGLATNAAALVNGGTAATPVQMTFTGPLATPQISNGAKSIYLQTLGAGEVVTVQSDTLLAFAPGGATRASYVLAGSVPMPLATGSTTWSLYATGTGNVALTWSSAWS